MFKRPLCLCLALISGISAHAQLGTPPPSSGLQGGGNVLMVVVDDVGLDQLSSYGVGVDLPSTPNIDKLAQDGVRFMNVWANPVCSPTRAALLTGRYSFRNGVGHTVNFGGHPLPTEEVLLPELLDQATGGLYEHAAFGKWHLGDSTNGGSLAPNIAGFGHFAGVLDNVQNYYIYQRTVDGLTYWTLGYQTSDTVDDFLSWEAEREGPWFAYVAFNAPHYPWHAPPPSLHSVDLSSVGTPNETPRPYYKAMVESIDAEVGRLLDGLGSELSETTVIFTSDNGTPPEVVLPPFDWQKAKATLFEPGVRVPLIVSGPAVLSRGAVVTSIVNSSDLFATVAELAGIGDAGSHMPARYSLDSVSIVPYLENPSCPPLRKFVYAEIFLPGGFGPFTLEGRAIRTQQYKLVRSSLPGGGLYGSSLFDLRYDPLETKNLLRHGLSPQHAIALAELDRTLKLIYKP